jgi:actin-related protein
VTELGEGTSTVVPVFEGYVLTHALEKSTIAGQSITRILEEEITKKYASSKLQQNCNQLQR